MGVVDDMFAFLTNAGIAGGSTAWTLMRRRLMDSPAKPQAVVLTEDGGDTPEISAAQGIGDAALYDIGIQVMVRGKPWDGDATRAKAQEIYDALHGQRAIVLGSRRYLRVQARTPEPIFLGFDETSQPRHTVSFLCLIDARNPESGS